MARKDRKANLSQDDENAMMEAIGEESTSAPVEEDAPSYRVIGESKIPVSKVRGKLWKARRDERIHFLKDIFDSWDENEAYYHATQDQYRKQTDDTTTVNKSGPMRQRRNRVLTEQENIVFANTAALVPSLYAKNPEISVTGTDDSLRPMYEANEQLMNVIINREQYPGVNLKPKVRKSIISAALCNEGWIEFGWTFKEESSEKALLDLKQLSDEFAKCTDTKRLKEIEGQIMALEAKIEVLTPSGPWAKYRTAKQVLVDPNSQDDDPCGDAGWIMVFDYFPTNALNALYAKKDKNGNWVSEYAPTHRMMTSQNEGHNVDEQVNNFRLFTNEDAKEKNRDKSLDVTKVWYVYDKVTRRIELYSDVNWSWPIWVWEDRLHLQEFFSIRKLQFHTSSCTTRMKGEVSYYVDQQDSINEINDAEARARDMVKNNGFFDKGLGIDDKTVMEVINGPDGTMKGVTVPEGKKLDDLFLAVTPEYLKYPTLFDDAAKNRKLQAIDRIASVGEIQRGGQFKTNTTNKAIDTYNSINNTRLDDRIDAIEDFIGKIAWGLNQICLQHMDPNVVKAMIGSQRAENWTNMTPEEIFTTFSSARVEGGSTQKPTSKAKKQEALELMQILGQFAGAAPGPVTKVMFRVGERAFDEFVMDDEDWDELNNELAFREGSATAPITPAVEQAIAQLPPEAQTAVMNAIQQGVPPEEAIAQVTQLLTQQQQQPTVQ